MMGSLVGLRFGRLVVARSIKGDRRTLWICRCDCGGETIRPGYLLKSGHTRSCGCLHSESIQKINRTRAIHGEARNGAQSPEYMAWAYMIKRCINPKFAGYKYYGGRGIYVCDEWRDSFESFLSHVGRRPSSRHSIDRIDVNGNYEPGNVRWATAKEQANNRRPHAPPANAQGEEVA